MYSSLTTVSESVVGDEFILKYIFPFLEIDLYCDII